MELKITTPTADGKSSEVRIVKALRYAYPKVGNGKATARVTFEGEPLDYRMTGGGKYPTYTYLMIDGSSYYLPKNVVLGEGADITRVAASTEEAKEVKAEVKEEVKAEVKEEAKAEPAPAPMKPKRTRVRKEATAPAA